MRYIACIVAAMPHDDECFGVWLGCVGVRARGTQLLLLRRLFIPAN